MLAGIDEAGRGCVIGPLVMALVACNSRILSRDKEVRDSKELSPKKREIIFSKYKKKVIYQFFIVEPKTIDEKNLNELELNGIKQLIKDNLHLNIRKVYVDSPFRNCKELSNALSKEFSLCVILEHNADRRYKIASLASIFAKVKRDQLVSELKKQIGKDFGSGYPSDRKTRDFIKNNYTNAIGIIRTKWKTIKSLRQGKLNEY